MHMQKKSWAWGKENSISHNYLHRFHTLKEYTKLLVYKKIKTIINGRRFVTVWVL